MDNRFDVSGGINRVIVSVDGDEDGRSWKKDAIVLVVDGLDFVNFIYTFINILIFRSSSQNR